MRIIKGLTKKQKQIIILILGLFLMAIIICLIWESLYKIGNGEKVPANPISKITKDKHYQDLVIHDIEIESTDKITHLMANITNTGEIRDEQIVDIVFLDKNDKELGRTSTYISSIHESEAIRIDVVIDKKYVKADNFRIEKAKEE